MRNLCTSAISVLILGALMGLSVACSHRPSDDAIAKDIQNKLAADSETKDAQVNVAVKDGKVTLTGKVSTPAVQQKVEQIAREEPDIAGVDDQTTTEPEAEAAVPDAAAPAAARSSCSCSPSSSGGEAQTSASRSARRDRSNRQNRSSIEFQEQPNGPSISRDAGATREREREVGADGRIDRQWHRGDGQGQGQGKR